MLVFADNHICHLCTICVLLFGVLLGVLSFFAAKMKKKLLYIAMLFLSMRGSIMAQQLYLCRCVEAYAYELNAMMRLEVETDSFRIRQHAYAFEEVDNLVFHRPELFIRKLGWWGDMTDGLSFYKERLRAEIDDNLEDYGLEYDELEPFDYDVLFIIEAQGGI